MNSVLTSETTPCKQASAPKIITAQRLARALPGLRAEHAARWLEDAGKIKLKPTARLACLIFGVSYPRLKAAKARLEQRERSKRRALNGNGAVVFSDNVVDRFVHEIGPDRILAALDGATQPQLPLQN